MNFKKLVWVVASALSLSGLWGDDVLELSPYEVAAWHFDGLAMAIPAGVLRLEQEEIEKSGAGSVPELLERAGGIRIRGTSGNGMDGQVALRGFGDNSGLRALILVDGQVFNPPDMGGINWLGLDVSELEMVEVLRGGQTVLYGNHAVSGVIKLKTRQPGKELEGTLHGEVGSDRLGRAGLSLGQGIGQVGLRGGLNWFEVSGYREHSRMQGMGGGLSWTIERESRARWSGRIRVDETRNEFPGPLTYEAMVEDPRQSVTGLGDQSENLEKQITLMGEGDSQLGDWQVNAAFLSRGRDSSFQGIEAANQLRRVTFSPRMRLMRDSGFVILGGDFGWDQLDFSDYATTERKVVRAWADMERVSSGGYSFISHELGHGLTLSGGLRGEIMQTDNRYVRYKEEQLFPFIETNRGTYPNPDYREAPEADPQLSYEGPIDKTGWAGEVSVLKSLHDGLHLWAGWDRVYRYPALDEAASYQGYPLSDPLNAQLEPESGNNFEIGLKRFENNWHIGVTVFHLLLDDEISFDEAARLNVNIGNTRRTGVEVDISYQKDRYGATFHGSWTDAGFRGDGIDRQLPLVPEIEGSVALWVRPMDSVRLQVHARYLSEQHQGNDFSGSFRSIASYGLADFSVFWEPSESLTFSFGLNNLFDKVFASSAYSGGFYPGAGRRGYVRGKYRF